MNWLVVRTKPNKEGVVKKLLGNSSVDVIIPTEKISKKDKVINKKLMPGYIFVAVDYDNIDVFNLLRNTEGILSFDYNSKTLSDSDIKNLIPEDQRPVTELESLGAKKGDLLYINEGPMQGQQGVLEKIDMNKHTATVNVAVFNRVTPVKVGIESLELVR